MAVVVRLSYGTAGFRAEASLLAQVAAKVGEFAVWLSRRAGGQAIGIMITASHNPVSENGIKLIMPNGEMMAEEFEGLLESFAHGEATLENAVGEATVAIARDNRPSGPHLVELISNAVAGSKILDWGLCTTPEAHFFVKRYNDTHETLKELRRAYLASLAIPDMKSVIIDCANGVGALPLRSLVDNSFLVNTGEEGVLNEQCGADWVKTKGCLPSNFGTAQGLCASLDGDADRVVFFQANPFFLLDGDRIACLFATLLKHFKVSGIGVVQTAYANGASTEYLRSLGIPVVCTPTGVKHLHRAAHEFPVGIYFEANGHGTVLFKDEVKKGLSSVKVELSSWADLFNPCVGDGIADLFAVLKALQLLNWGINDWMGLYREYPNVLRKVPVPRRGMIVTKDADRRVISPYCLQPLIDQAVSQFKGGRAFVRASGTENVVRVYAEVSDSMENACLLADQVEQVVREHLK